jgi:hypothetical protein
LLKSAKAIGVAGKMSEWASVFQGCQKPSLCKECSICEEQKVESVKMNYSSTLKVCIKLGWVNFHCPVLYGPFRHLWLSFGYALVLLLLLFIRTTLGAYVSVFSSVAGKIYCPFFLLLSVTSGLQKRWISHITLKALLTVFLLFTEKLNELLLVGSSKSLLETKKPEKFCLQDGLGEEQGDHETGQVSMEYSSSFHHHLSERH